VKMHGLWCGTVGVRGNRSVLTRSFQRPPLKVAKPFAGEQGELLLYLMDSSPGLFNGDTQEIECTLEKGARLFLTNQSACKLHPSSVPGDIRQTQRFHLKEGAILEYFPEPIIPYKDASYQGETLIHLETGAQAILAEVIAPGRAGREELFQYRKVASQFSVFWGDQWTVWDSLLLEPSRWRSPQEVFAEFTHMGTLWVLSEQVDDEHVEKLNLHLTSQDPSSMYAGCSRLTCHGLVVRMLGRSAWAIQSVINDCWNLIRRDLIGAPALAIRK
jgi:urease accessory protein